MPATIERKGHVSLNDHIAEYVKTDREFIEGIKEGVRACVEGRVRRWSEIKRELKLH